MRLLSALQVVLANGSIIEANRTSYADLHKALKGGINNFGIVTRFDLKAFPQGQIWGGDLLTIGNVQGKLKWLEQFSQSSGKDFDPNGMVMMTFTPNLGGFIVAALLTYAQPTRNPPSVQGLYNNSIATTMGMTTYLSVARANGIGTPAGGRGFWATFTFHNNLAFMKEALDLIGKGGAGVIFQPLWAAPRLKSFRATGGNVLGLEDTKEDLIIVLLMFTSLSAAGDAAVTSRAKQLLENLKNAAQAKGVYSPYVYANYAADFQDVIGGYGTKARDFMISVSQKYDPDQLFQKQVPGGFKLNPSLNSPTTPSSTPKSSAAEGTTPPITASTGSTAPSKGTTPKSSAPKGTTSLTTASTGSAAPSKATTPKMGAPKGAKGTSAKGPFL